MEVERFGGRVGHDDRPKCRNTAVPHMQDKSREDAKWNYNRNVSRTSTSTASCYQTRYASKTIIIWRKKNRTHSVAFDFLLYRNCGISITTVL